MTQFSKLSSLQDFSDWFAAHRPPWRDVLAIYLLAGACHTAGKILRSWRQARRQHRILKDVPWGDYPNPESFLGFFSELRKNIKRDKDWFNEASAGKPISKFIGMKIEPNQVWLIVRDPACIRHFLKDSFEKYTKPSPTAMPFMWYLSKWLGLGIFSMQHGIGAPDGGKGWQTQRKIASNIFSRANFQHNMGEVFVRKAHRLRELLDQSAAAGRYTDLQKLFFGFTMDSITDIFFGEDADTMGDGLCPYGDAFDAAHRSLVTFVRPAQATLYQLTYLPWPFGGFGGLAWKIYELRSPLHREFQRAMAVLDQESNRIVKSARDDPNLGHRRDLLALFLQAEEKEQFSAKYLRDMVMNFVIAGRDTTACTLSWMFYILAVSPEIQRRLVEEIDARFPDGSEPTLKGLSASNMPYLNGVLYEVLRLYPPVPSDSKQCVADDVFPDGTRIPSGTTCLWQPYCMGRDPAVYPQPEVVRPERWIPFSAPPPHEFAVFQAGPRICLGMDMATFEAKLVATMLLQRYTFELKPGEAENIHYAGTITLSLCNSKNQDSHNLWLLPKRRRA